MSVNLPHALNGHGYSGIAASRTVGDSADVRVVHARSQGNLNACTARSGRDNWARNTPRDGSFVSHGECGSLQWFGRALLGVPVAIRMIALAHQLSLLSHSFAMWAAVFLSGWGNAAASCICTLLERGHATLLACRRGRVRLGRSMQPRENGMSRVSGEIQGEVTKSAMSARDPGARNHHRLPGAGRWYELTAKATAEIQSLPQFPMRVSCGALAGSCR